MNSRESEVASLQRRVDLQWGVKIPLRDGIHLDATLYLPKNRSAPVPAVFTLTPYIGQTYHEQGMYFAAHGYPFLTVDVRGRGNSEGAFRPFINEGKDGSDIVEWLARQPFCNGQVTMWGGSYAGFNQWTTAAQRPGHLATIVPVASPYLGVDFPMRGNISYPYVLQWLTLVSGKTSQDRIFWNNDGFWSAKFREWFEAGIPFRQMDARLGNPSATFQEWMAHPERGSYWDEYNPSPEQYAGLEIPILTITGVCDGDQPGALTHYRQHMKNASAAARARHYLVIGPWDHAGTRTPAAEFSGLKVGPASLVNLQKLHLDWYAWTMQEGPKPAFLRKNVAYYVMGADEWRYVDALDEITATSTPYFLTSTGNPTDVFHSGSLVTLPVQGEPDSFIYDPGDLSHAELESSIDPWSWSDQTLVHAAVGRQLIYHTAPFAAETEVSGFFKLSLWVSIDQPDTDFKVAVYEVDVRGDCILLATDLIRARYRDSPNESRLISTKQPLRYDFDCFTFVSRRVGKWSRLRLVIAPLNSMHTQKNYNSGGKVADESLEVGRPVTVTLFHDETHPSALYVPFGKRTE